MMRQHQTVGDYLSMMYPPVKDVTLPSSLNVYERHSGAPSTTCMCIIPSISKPGNLSMHFPLAPRTARRSCAIRVAKVHKGLTILARTILLTLLWHGPWIYDILTHTVMPEPALGHTEVGAPCQWACRWRQRILMAQCVWRCCAL